MLLILPQNSQVQRDLISNLHIDFSFFDLAPKTMETRRTMYKFPMKFRVQVKDHGPSKPSWQTNVESVESIPTSLPVAIPPGFEIQVRPRSGLALKHGITVPNTPGTIDSDYRGELKVILINHGGDPFEIRRGDRIAQLVLAPVTRASWLKVDELDETQRGEGGFGSTGGVVSLGA